MESKPASIDGSSSSTAGARGSLVNRSISIRPTMSTLMTNSNEEDDEGEDNFESNSRGSTARSTSSVATTARRKESASPSSLSRQPFANGEPIIKNILNTGVSEKLLASITGTYSSIQEEVEVESSEHLTLERQVQMLRSKLSRRNALIEEIRRSYYSDIIIIKDELRNREKERQHCSSHSSISVPTAASGTSSTATIARSTNGAEDHLKGIPSIDLRDVLPLFAPEEAALQIHPCDKCGGTVELVHGESKEVAAARQEMQRAVKAEAGMKTLVHRMRTEAKESAELTEALQQRVRSLVKENAYTLEQLQTSRKSERDQKTIITNLRSKLQLAHGTQDQIDLLSAEYKECKQQLAHSNRERDIFSASTIHLKDELSEVTKNLHQLKVEMAQLESDYGETYYKLQEELKKSKQLSEDLSVTTKDLEEKQILITGLQTSNTSLKEELVSSLQRFDETKRHLEDQLIEEERSREEIQEQASELRRQIKKLLKQIEDFKQKPGADENKTSKDVVTTSSSGRYGDMRASGGATYVPTGVIASSQEIERAYMREQDMMSQLARLQGKISGFPNGMGGYYGGSPRSGPKRTYSGELDIELPADFGLPVTSNMNTSQTERSFGGPTGRFGGNPIINCGQMRTANNSSGGNTTDSGGNSSGVNSSGAVADPVITPPPPEMEMDCQFEAYSKETHRTLSEITELTEKNTKGDLKIAELEKKQQTTQYRLDEARANIELLNTTIDSLKARLNQGSAGVAEMMEDMLGQIENANKELQVEAQKTSVLMQFIVKLSTHIHGLSQNVSLLVPIELEKIHDDSPENSSKADSLITGGDAVAKIKELRTKILLDKAYKRFEQLTHNRADMIIHEITKLVDAADNMKEALDQAETKAEEDDTTIQLLKQEIARYQLNEEDHLNKITSLENDFNTSNVDCINLKQKVQEAIQEMEDFKNGTEQIRDDHKKMLMKLVDKTKAWEKAMSLNEDNSKRIANLEEELENVTTHRDRIQIKLQDIEDLQEYRKLTSRSVEISAIVEMVESGIQTDRWRPPGLELRQRNAPDKMPQRYLGKASVLIASNEFEKLGIPRTGASTNQESTGFLRPNTSMGRVGTEENHVIELDLYPPSRVGGRQIKTSHGSRPRALSKIVLSSDAISRRFVSPMGSPREGFQDGISFDPSDANVDFSGEFTPFS